MERELKPFSPVYARGVRGEAVRHISWSRVRSILSAATASLLVGTLALTMAFPDAIYGALAAITGVTQASPVTEGNAALSPLGRRLTSVMAGQRTEFIRVNSLIRVTPGADGPVLKVREEYLVGVFGSEMKHGFRRQFHLAEPVQDGAGRFGLGPRLQYQIKEVSRRPLPFEAVAQWTPLLDSNDQLGFPAPRRFDTALSETGSGVSVALGEVGDPLLPGVYVFRVDYEVRGAATQEDQDTFVFTALQPLTLPVQEFHLQVTVDQSLQSEAGVGRLAVRPYTVAVEETEPDAAPEIRAEYREGWEVLGQRTEEGSVLIQFAGSKLDPMAGLQVAVRWR